ncbi:MAG: hypothetical protein B7Z33_07030 [Sphingomonadales bacterium 12-68-11]|nr:MAG: hypothetical protein B7Z33_07030 [Sphingomonadales bacterium 12-68-11]
MAEPVSDDVARNRWLVIQAVRAAGVAMVMIGVLGLGGRIDLPPAAAYILAVVGIVDVFLVPRLLARRWRTPKP